MSDRGTVGIKENGFVLELPAGVDVSGRNARPAPAGRLRFRYNDVTKDPEVSVDAGPYAPLATLASVPAYGELYVVDGVTPQAVAGVFELMTLWTAIGPVLRMTGALGPMFRLTASVDGAFRCSFSLTMVGDTGEAYEWAVAVDGVASPLRCATGNNDGTSARVVSCDGLLELTAGQAVTVLVRSVTGAASYLAIHGQLTLTKED